MTPATVTPTSAARPATLRRLARVFRPYWRLFTLLLVASAVNAALGLTGPLLTARLIDRALPRKDLPLLTALVLLVVAAALVAGLISVGQSYLRVLVAQGAMRDLRLALYAHLHALSLRFYTTARTGDIISRCSNDVNGMGDVLTTLLGAVLGNVATVGATVLGMLSLNGPLTLLSVCLVPIFLYPTYRMGLVRRRMSARTQEAMADVSSLLEETLGIGGVLLVKGFGRQQAAVNRFAQATDQLRALEIRQTMIGRWFYLLFHLIFAVAPALVYYVGGRAVIGGTLSLGGLVAFVALQGRLFPPLGELLSMHLDLQGALALFDRIFASLDLPVEIGDRPGAQPLDSVVGHIRFRHVGFHYHPGRATLTDIDFEAHPGQLIAFVGPSGAGKTTIGYLLARLYDVEQGAVEIDGHDVRGVTLGSLGRHIGLVTQEPYVLNATVRENITFGRPAASEADLMAAATAAHIHERIMALPAGYDTVVGARGYTLSGGEKQRLALARVILTDPRILILDEATSALDTQSERLIQAALERFMAGRTTVAIAHRLSTILAADQILLVDDGRIVERGTHARLLRQGGRYERLYHEQFNQEHS